MCIANFYAYINDGLLFATINLIGWSGRIYATTGQMLFYLLCRIISENYVNIRKEIEIIKNIIRLDVDFVSDRLTELAHQHLLVCQCVDKLNQCFGLILLIEITCIFVNEINAAMYLLVALYINSNDWLRITINLTWNIYALVNFSIICFSSNKITNEVYFIFIDPNS